MVFENSDKTEKKASLLIDNFLLQIALWNTETNKFKLLLYKICNDRQNCTSDRIKRNRFPTSITQVLNVRYIYHVCLIQVQEVHLDHKEPGRILWINATWCSVVIMLYITIDSTIKLVARKKVGKLTCLDSKAYNFRFYIVFLQVWISTF